MSVSCPICGSPGESFSRTFFLCARPGCPNGPTVAESMAVTPPRPVTHTDVGAEPDVTRTPVNGGASHVPCAPGSHSFDHPFRGPYPRTCVKCDMLQGHPNGAVVTGCRPGHHRVELATVAVTVGSGLEHRIRCRACDIHHPVSPDTGVSLHDPDIDSGGWYVGLRYRLDLGASYLDIEVLEWGARLAWLRQKFDVSAGSLRSTVLDSEGYRLTQRVGGHDSAVPWAGGGFITQRPGLIREIVVEHSTRMIFLHMR